MFWGLLMIGGMMWLMSIDLLRLMNIDILIIDIIVIPVSVVFLKDTTSLFLVKKSPVL